MDRLEGIKKECQRDYDDDIAWLICEIERLRKALEDIAEHSEKTRFDSFSGKRARQALKEGK